MPPSTCPADPRLVAVEPEDQDFVAAAVVGVGQAALESETSLVGAGLGFELVDTFAVAEFLAAESLVGILAGMLAEMLAGTLAAEILVPPAFQERIEIFVVEWHILQ